MSPTADVLRFVTHCSKAVREGQVVVLLRIHTAGPCSTAVPFSWHALLGRLTVEVSLAHLVRWALPGRLKLQHMVLIYQRWSSSQPSD